MRNLCRVLTAILIVSLWFSSVTGATFHNVVAFGDSLTDNGNIYSATFGRIPDPKEYYKGRFSNGPVWVEYLADQLRLAGELHDYAFGGAETGKGSILPGLGTQVNLYILSADRPKKTLYTVWAGANDFLNGDADAEEAINNMMDALHRLVSTAGARHILVANLPDLGATPGLRGTDRSGEGSKFSREFNRRLESALDVLEAEFVDLVLYRFDTFDLLNGLLEQPEAYGFSYVAGPCPSFGEDFLNREGCLFWDAVHPSTEAHRWLGIVSADAVSTGCVAISDDLSLSVPCAVYQGVSVGFRLRYSGGTAGDPKGHYWKADPSSLGAGGISGTDCALLGEHFDLTVPCAEFDGKTVKFVLGYMGHTGEDPDGFYWKLDPGTIEAE